MPRYYIDTDDSAFAVHDENGQEFVDIVAASNMAYRTLPEMARQKPLNGQRQTFTASIRNGRGTILYVATLTFSGEWKVPLSSV